MRTYTEIEKYAPTNNNITRMEKTPLNFIDDETYQEIMQEQPRKDDPYLILSDDDVVALCYIELGTVHMKLLTPHILIKED